MNWGGVCGDVLRRGVSCWVACRLEGRCLERQSKRSSGVYHLCGGAGEKVPGSGKRAWR